jgi:hypothetical protein
MLFKKEEIQVVVNEIQKEADTPDFMAVTVYDDFILDKYGTIRDAEDEEALYPTKYTERADILKELAESLIDMSL